MIWCEGATDRGTETEGVEWVNDENDDEIAYFSVR